MNIVSARTLAGLLGLAGIALAACDQRSTAAPATVAPAAGRPVRLASVEADDAGTRSAPATVAALNALVAEVPREAHVAASSKVAPHLLPRRYIYNFPPAPYSPSFDRVEYVLVAPAASADVSNPLPSGKTALQALVLDSGQFRLLDERAGYRLFQRTTR